ncbi:MAG: hypothetical protein EBV24_05550 [Actinobacteria bacterium]|nr:hypothetical protein [Actinomycetota bacterium]
MPTVFCVDPDAVVDLAIGDIGSQRGDFVGKGLLRPIRCLFLHRRQVLSGERTNDSVGDVGNLRQLDRRLRLFLRKA